MVRTKWYEQNGADKMAPIESSINQAIQLPLTISAVTIYEATEATASVNFLASVKSITCLGEKLGIFVTTIIQQCCLGLTQGIYISEIRSLGLTLTESFIIQCFCSTAVIHP